MNEYKKRWQLKNLAKDRLTGNYSEAVLLTLIYGVLAIANSVLNTVLMCSASGESTLMRILFMQITPSGYLISLGVSFLTSILFSLLQVGMAFFYLNIACKQPYSLKDLFIAFREQPGKYVLISLVISVVQFFFALPGYACDYFYLINPTDQWMFLSYVCQILGQLITIPIVLALAQSYRLLLDYPSLSAKEAMVKSCHLMKGHNGRLFVLELSFLPLQIAAIFTCGIGYLWLSPYMHMTYALFYLDLMEKQDR